MPGQPGCRRPSLPGQQQSSGLLAVGPDRKPSGHGRGPGQQPCGPPPRTRTRRYGAFCHTEMLRLLSPVNGARCQSPQRARKVIPASRAIRSSSDGHT